MNVNQYDRGFNDGVAAARKAVNDMSTTYQKNFPGADEDLLRAILSQLDRMKK